MLGRRDSQRCLGSAAAQLPVEAIDAMGFYGQLARYGHRIFSDDDFAQIYSMDNGRPSCPPSMLALARLLQHYENCSDTEVVNRVRFDLRWKAALDLDLYSIDSPFSRSTYQAFRVRLSLAEAEGIAFEKSVRAGCEAGLIPEELRLAVDSSPVDGRGAVRDTYNLLSDAIAKVLRVAARHRGEPVDTYAAGVGLDRHVSGSSIKASEVVDWSDDQAKRRFLAGLLADARRVVAMAQRAGVADDEVGLLTKVIDQDVQRGRGKLPQIRNGVAADRMPSVSDPQIRHGRKSSGKTYTGHKAHLAVDLSSGIVTAVDMTAPAAADGEQLAALVEQTVALTDHRVTLVIGDTAYGSRTAHEQADTLGLKLVTKMASAPTGRFAPCEFTVSKDGQTARCPAGVSSIKIVRHDDGYRHQWSPEHCQSCPFKRECTTAAARSLTVGADFHERRQRERYAQSDKGRALLRQRVAVEHVIGRVKNLGAGAARYFGRGKTLAQLQWSAAVTNLSLVWAGQPPPLS